MMNMGGGYFQNPYGRPMKSPEQLQVELNNSLANYQNLFQMAQGYQQPCQQQAPSGRKSGEYVEVLNDKEMEDAPVRLDGTPTLFINFGNGTLWSKRYVNGKPVVKGFSIAPLFPDSKEEAPKINYVDELSKETPSKETDSMAEVVALLKELLRKGDESGSNQANPDRKRDNESEGSAGDGAQSSC